MLAMGIYFRRTVLASPPKCLREHFNHYIANSDEYLNISYENFQTTKTAAIFVVDLQFIDYESYTIDVNESLWRSDGTALGTYKIEPDTSPETVSTFE